MLLRTVSPVAAGLFFLASGWLGTPDAAHAQDPGAVAADRPGFGDGTAVVAPGRFQIEAGYAYSQDGPRDQHALGQLVLRLGVGRGVELRTLLNSYVLQRGGAESEGFEDVGVGAKISLLAGSSTPLGTPALALLLGTTLPTGDDALTSDEVTPELKLALDLNLTDVLAFSANAGYTFTPGDDLTDTFSTYASLGAALPGADGWGVFAGLYSLFPRNGASGHGLDGGLTFLPTPATQLDVNVGVGLSDDQPDVGVGVGFARRF